MLVGQQTSAQNKIAYIRIDDIVGLMPQLKTINMDTIGTKYIQDSVLPRYQFVEAEYNRKVKELEDTTKPIGVRTEILKSMQENKAELDGFDNVVKQVQQFQQQELLKPYYARARKAINDVAKEKGYTHVLSTDIFLVAPAADDLSLAVLAKLGIPPPSQR